ncbi:threonine/serine exporter ThrE family protein [Microbacterium sp.]|uniref:threonine/serine ThrE exporter family protein n=1 Tax=Microbacterium sp. TaxID=51671 RepID=UPI0027375E25|nr:threonine/serine exporter family protein [Microbacterium sp.]MDP3950482.1 threonine/serine exporter family protein [Microbacterium sp.]
MSPERQWRLLTSVRRAIRTDPSEVALTEAYPVLGETIVVKILDLALRIGESMFAVGASAHDVTFAITRVAQVYGLTGVQVDVTFNAIGVSYHRGEEDWPTTLLRVVRAASPDHAKLQRLQALLVDITEGMELTEARIAFRIIRRTPFLYRPIVVIVARALLTVGVALLFSASPLIILLTFVAALCAAFTQAGLARLQVPSFFSQIAGAFVITAFATITSALGTAGITPFNHVQPSVIVASGIVLMLSGLTVVGAAQDAIDGFALTAGGRILDLTMQTVGVVLGILIGLELARLVGYSMALPDDALPFGPLPAQIAGAMIIAVAVALFNGAGMRIILVSAVLSVIAIIGYSSTILLDVHEGAASAVGALLASFIGILISRNLHVPSVAVTTAAIVPLVPGSAVFRGLLGLVDSDGTAEGMLVSISPLVLAASIGVGLAAGASLGLYLGTPLRATLASVAKSRARVRR